jgi:hypothetical protein
MLSIFDTAKRYLQSTDDPELWQVVLQHLGDHVRRKVARAETCRDVVLSVGACSSWLRPHQTRFRVESLEFAWPSGYGGTHYSRTGLPLYDWCCCFRLDRESRFVEVEQPRPQDRRQLLCRATLPTNTMRRWKAAIHTIWLPGTPRCLREPTVWLLGYNRRNGRGDWELRGSHCESGRHWKGEVFPKHNRKPCDSNQTAVPCERVLPDDISLAEKRY